MLLKEKVVNISPDLLLGLRRVSSAIRSAMFVAERVNGTMYMKSDADQNKPNKK